MNVIEHRRDGYLVSTDRARLDPAFIHDYLSRSTYWAQERPFAIVAKSVEHSLCFGLYMGTQQVGFARVVTDYATFAWLCDLFVVEAHRDQGLGKWLVECIVAHPELQTLSLFLLGTRDAHGLYRRYGDFEEVTTTGRLMVRRRV